MFVDEAPSAFDVTSSGTTTAELALLNFGSSKVSIGAAKPGDEDCTITIDPSELNAARRTDATLTFEGGCEVSDGATVRPTFAPSDASTITAEIAFAKAPASQPRFWRLLLFGVLSGVIAAGVVIHFLQKNGSSKKLATGLGTDFNFRENWVFGLTHRYWIHCRQRDPSAESTQEVAQ